MPKNNQTKKTKYAKDINYSSKISLNIYGRQPLLEALRSDVEIKEVWLSDGLSGPSVHQIQELIKTKEVPSRLSRKDDLQKLVGPVVHQGVAASIVLNTIPDEEALLKFLAGKDNPLVLILDQIQDPHNLGAILRTAEISGVQAVIFPFKGSAELNATVAKTSAGAMFYIPIYRSRELMETFDNLKSINLKLLATLPRAQQSMYQTNFKQGCAILVGNEGQGVRKNLLPFCDETLYIPQFGKVQSLNASVSTAVVLYEALRQRHFK